MALAPGLAVGTSDVGIAGAAGTIAVFVIVSKKTPSSPSTTAATLVLFRCSHSRAYPASAGCDRSRMSTARRPRPTGTRCCTWAGPTPSRRTPGSTGSGPSTTSRRHTAAGRLRQGRSATGGAEPLMVSIKPTARPCSRYPCRSSSPRTPFWMPDSPSPAATTPTATRSRLGAHGLRGERVGVPQHGRRDVLLRRVGGFLWGVRWPYGCTPQGFLTASKSRSRRRRPERDRGRASGAHPSPRAATGRTVGCGSATSTTAWPSPRIPTACPRVPPSSRLAQASRAPTRTSVVRRWSVALVSQRVAGTVHIWPGCQARTPAGGPRLTWSWGIPAGVMVIVNRPWCRSWWHLEHRSTRFDRSVKPP